MLYSNPRHLYSNRLHMLYLNCRHMLYLNPSHMLYSNPRHLLYSNPRHMVYSTPCHMCIGILVTCLFETAMIFKSYGIQELDNATKNTNNNFIERLYATLYANVVIS